MTLFNQKYWDAFYQQEKQPWDMGHVAPPLKAYFDQLTNRQLKILLPGAGKGYEAEYLWKKGFSNVFIAELSSLALEQFKKRVPDFPHTQLLNVDFFELQDSFDLIVEHVFFCALHPAQRLDYARKMYELLQPQGKLVGLLFDFPLQPDQTDPPFGGSRAEYLTYFNPLFEIKKLERCYNSHPKRQGRELFMILTPRKEPLPQHGTV